MNPGIKMGLAALRSVLNDQPSSAPPRAERRLPDRCSDDKITQFKDGVRSEHPRARCSCGGIIDAHPTMDASICRGCEKMTDGADAFRIQEAA